MRLPTKRVTTRRLNDHDFGAEIGEHPSGDRGRLTGEINDAQTVEQ